MASALEMDVSLNRLLILVAATTAAGTAAEAQVAKPSISASLGYTKKEDSELSAVQARMTGRFHRYFGAEIEGALGIEPRTSEFPTVPHLAFKTQLRRELGVYGIGYLPVMPKAELFARIGYANSWLKRTGESGGTFAVTKTDVGSWNYGVGAQYFLDGKNGLRLDYTRQNFKDRTRTDDTWAVAYTRRF
jgi:outer membrane immunogenic protein